MSVEIIGITREKIARLTRLSHALVRELAEKERTASMLFYQEMVFAIMHNRESNTVKTFTPACAKVP